MSTVIGYLVAIVIIALILAASYGALLQRRYPRERQSGVPSSRPLVGTETQASPRPSDTRDVCRTCGLKMRAGARFCASCGADAQASD